MRPLHVNQGLSADSLEEQMRKQGLVMGMPFDVQSLKPTAESAFMALCGLLTKEEGWLLLKSIREECCNDES